MYFQRLLPGILWGALLLFSACAQESIQDPHRHDDGSFKTTIVTGRFEGFDSYKNWIVYLSGPHYKSGTSKVGADGAFQIRAVNIHSGDYRLYFGKSGNKYLGSMRVKVDSQRTHLGVIQAGQ
jgi:hypothetical protein